MLSIQEKIERASIKHGSGCCGKYIFNTALIVRLEAQLVAHKAKKGKYSVSLICCLQREVIRYWVLGSEHPDTLPSMNNLAFTLKGQGRNGEAISLLGKCSQLRKHVLGPQHPWTTLSLETLKEWQVENNEIGV
jgi:hypothetical protein